MHRHQDNGLPLCTFASLEAYPELIHAVTTRNGGVSKGRFASLNLSKGVGDDPEAVDENLDRVCSALGVATAAVVSPVQRHTANVRRVGAANRGQAIPDCDVLVTDEPDVVLMLRFADCTPVMLYDPRHHALALAHSGWRGTVQGAAREAVAALVREYDSTPGDLIAAVGPSIGPCCYEVGDEVVAAVQDAFPQPDGLLQRSPQASGRYHFDLWAANQRWLREAGVRHIEVASVCTSCHRDEFFSYRAAGGRTGHFAGVLALANR